MYGSCIPNVGIVCTDRRNSRLDLFFMSPTACWATPPFQRMETVVFWAATALAARGTFSSAVARDPFESTETFSSATRSPSVVLVVAGLPKPSPVSADSTALGKSPRTQVLLGSWNGPY